MKDEPVFEVHKNGKVVFSGSNFDCYRYLLNHQPQSVHWAEKYGGWSFERKEKS